MCACVCTVQYRGGGCSSSESVPPIPHVRLLFLSFPDLAVCRFQRPSSEAAPGQCVSVAKWVPVGLRTSSAPRLQNGTRVSWPTGIKDTAACVCTRARVRKMNMCARVRDTCVTLKSSLNRPYFQQVNNKRIRPPNQLEVSHFERYKLVELAKKCNSISNDKERQRKILIDQYHGHKLKR